MDGKIINLPFLLSSSRSDFTCPDGEVESAHGVDILTTGSGNNNPGGSSNDSGNSGTPYNYFKDFRPEIPPVPLISFSLVRTTLSGWHIHPDAYPQKTVSYSETTDEARGRKAKELLMQFLSEARLSALFVQPVLVMAAWRMKNGAICSPSSPVLLIPNSRTPLIAASSANASGEELELRVAASVCALYHRITLPETLREWSDKISSLEIMVSRQLSFIDESKSLLPLYRVSPDSFCHSLDLSTGIATERPITSETFQLAWGAQVKNDSPLSLSDFFVFSSIPFNELKSSKDFKEIPYNCGNLDDVYSSPGIKPSWAPLSLSGATGGISFKGKTLLWGPEMKTPPYADISVSTPYSTEISTPRWIFHPDPEAKEFQYDSPDGRRIILPLKKHPGLYGSYYFGGFDKTPQEGKTTPNPTDGIRTSKLKEFLWLGEKSESAVFTDSGLQDAECGVIIAACRAFRSSGLVATTTPTLYLFTEEGIFLIRQNSDGTVTDAGLISSHILSDPSSIMVLPRGIRFTTRNGEAIIIEGTSVKSRSESDSSGSRQEIILAGKGENIEILTRPVKIDGGGDFKIMRRIYLRGSFTPATLIVSLEGSREMIHWYCLSRRESGAVIVTPRARFRFYRLKIKGSLKIGENLQGISLHLQ